MVIKHIIGSDKGLLISDCGDVYYPNGKLVKTSLSGSGYKQFFDISNGKGKNRYVHFEVARAFISNPLGLKEVNHIDHDKLNCNVLNLEWISHSDNMKDLAKYRLNNGYTSSRYSLDEYGNLKDKVFKCSRCGKHITKYAKKGLCSDCTRFVGSGMKTNSIGKNLMPKDIIPRLFKNKGNFEKSARELNITGNALRHRLAKFDLPVHSEFYKNLLKY